MNQLQLFLPCAAGVENLLATEIQRQAAMIGYINAFYLFATTAALAVPLAWGMRAPPATRA